MPSIPQRILYFLWPLLVIVGLSCARAPETAVLSGKITLRGQPLVWGKFLVMSNDNRMAWCEVKKGEYTLSNAPVGRLRVSVEGGLAERPSFSRELGIDNAKKTAEEIRKKYKGKKSDKEIDEEIANYHQDAAPDPNLVPGKYLNPATSDLTVEVKPGQQTYDVDLKP